MGNAHLPFSFNVLKRVPQICVDLARFVRGQQSSPTAYPTHDDAVCDRDVPRSTEQELLFLVGCGSSVFDLCATIDLYLVVTADGGGDRQRAFSGDAVVVGGSCLPPPLFAIGLRFGEYPARCC